MKRRDSSEIQIKRRNKELVLLKNLPSGYRFTHKEINIGQLIQAFCLSI